MANYINSLRTDGATKSRDENKINYYPTKVIDYDHQEEIYRGDNQYEQEKIRNEINRKIKNQAYQNEYNRVDNNLDYVNERLKLNNLSKSYLLNKINEFSTVKNENTELNEKENMNYWNMNRGDNNGYYERNQKLNFSVQQNNEVYNNQIGNYIV
jgi:hypothetical protein